MAEFILDAKGLLCPMPVIRTQDKVSQLKTGDTLKIVATDPGVLHDIPAWARINGHKLISSEEKQDTVIIVLEIS